MSFLVVGSNGIGNALSKKLSLHHQVFATYYQHPQNTLQNISFHYLNVLDKAINVDFLPDTLDGLAYCVGSINLKPFGRIDPESFVSDYE
ncbi:hypothetical protein ABTL74_19125, partial [Acinetobacter baumannii]